MIRNTLHYVLYVFKAASKSEQNDKYINELSLESKLI